MKPKRLITEPVRHAAMLALRPVEGACLRRDHAVPPPVFIVGAPRSGTSLLYELLVTHARFAYFSNLAHRLYQTPAAATAIGRRLIRGWTGELRSEYGHIAGWGAPNEGGWIWRRWTPEEHELDAAAAEHIDTQEMRRSVAAVSSIMHAPFISKNVMHSAHVGLLSSVFPGAVYIHITRDHTENARSLYRARVDAGGVNEWISVRPRGWEAYANRGPAEQVAAQVELTNRMIVHDTAVLPRVTLRYENLCEHTGEELERVLAALGGFGIVPQRREPAPAGVGRSPQRLLDDETESALHRAVTAWSTAQEAPRAGVG